MHHYVPTTPSALDRLSPAERDLVVALKVLGESDAQQLAEHLALSLSATRTTLSVLRVAGVARVQRSTPGSGRRRYYYSLTEQGHALFPGARPAAFESLARFVASASPGLWQEFIEAEASRYAQRVEERVANRPPDQRLRELARVYQECGFLTDVVEQGAGNSAELRVFHCPYVEQARDHPALCDQEPRIIAAAGFRDVERVAHQPDGARYCSFKFRLHDAGR